MCFTHKYHGFLLYFKASLYMVGKYIISFDHIGKHVSPVLFKAESLLFKDLYYEIEHSFFI